MSTTPRPGSEPHDEGPETVTVLVDGGRVSTVRAPAATDAGEGGRPEEKGAGDTDDVDADPLDVGHEDGDDEDDDDELAGPPTEALTALDFDDDNRLDRLDRPPLPPRRRAPSPTPIARAPVEAPPTTWEPSPRREAATPPSPVRARRDRGADDGESFLRRHLLPPGPIVIVAVVLLVGAVTGFTGAFIWANNDNGKVQTAPVVPPPVGRPTADTPEVETTTTTLPDLSPDALTAKLAPSVWTVSTFNSSGQPVQGSALVAGSANGQGLLITSLAVVEASTRQPTPDILVTGAGFKGPATLWTWDEGRDLALLVVTRTGAPAPPWISETSNLKDGDKVFALSGDGKLATGVVTAAPDKAVQHNIFVNDSLRGSPLVNVKGQVVAVLSANYTGGGTATDTTFFGVPIANACNAVLRCGGGPSAPDPAAKTTTTTTKPR